MKHSGWLAGLMLTVVMGCGDDRSAGGEARAGGGGTVQGAPSDITYAGELDVDLARMTRQPSGLYVQDLETGSGETAVAGRTAVVHYTGWLPDGTRFDSSHDRGEPFAFSLGAGEVIPGWDEGVEGMRTGGRRKLVIPSDLAYGPSGAGGVIPPDATLVFDVELLEVR
jgi:FKBP-type peptidyl-prolyl cis-trans isomerase FkpA